MKKPLLLLILLIIPVITYSQTVGDTFIYSNITYEITSLSPNHVKVTNYNTAGGLDVVIPNSVTPNASAKVASKSGSTNTTYTVTKIDNSAFVSKGITSVSIPSNVTNIGNTAFGDNNLTSVTIPDSVTSIGNQAFISNLGLTSVVLGTGVSSIGANAFDGSPSLSCVNSKATTPPTIYTGNGDTFGNANRANIDLFVPVGTSNTYTAASWTGFKTIQEGISLFTVNNIRYKVTSIANNTVDVLEYDTAGGTIVNIPATVNGGCTSGVFTVTGIANSAFSNTTSLTSVTIPDTVTSIGNYAFSNSGISSITLSNSLTSIGKQAFENNNLTSVTFFDGLVSIGDYAFQYNQLTSITFPATVNSIGAGAFRGNTSLVSVTSTSITPPTITTVSGPNDTFHTSGDRSGINLTIPQGTTGVYVTNTGALWTGFNSVTEDASLSTSTFEIENDIKVIISKDKIKIDAANSLILQNYTIYNINGSKIKSGKETIISIQDLSKGIYIVNITFDKGQLTKKFIK